MQYHVLAPKPPRSLLFSFLFLSFSGFAQKPSDNVISIIGQSKMMVSPDLSVFYVGIKQKSPDESKAITSLNEVSEKSLNKIVSAGFKKEEIRIAGFSVQETFSYSGQNPVKTGYEASQTLVLRFTHDGKKITQLLDKFSDKTDNITLNFSSELSTRKEAAARDSLKNSAMLDARKSADILARASGIKIIGVKYIEYPVEDRPTPVYSGYNAAMRMDSSAPSAFSTISVNEIELQERVKVVYVVGEGGK